MVADSDDELTLSSSTLDALKAFYAERDDHARRFSELQSAAETAADQREAQSASEGPVSMAAFAEDWNKSQFWVCLGPGSRSRSVAAIVLTVQYSDATANILARQLLDGATASSTVVAVSAPSVFVALKNLVPVLPLDQAALPPDQRPRLVLLEHDSRFTVFGADFIFYDVNEPTKLPASLRGCADRIICDPPFLSEDCQTKAALTARWLARPSTTTADAVPADSPATRVIVCTGERMEALVTTKLYRAQGVRTTTFEPEHAHGLSNEFYCYANFECSDWTWRAKGS